jgi:hypothetical protein
MSGLASTESMRRLDNLRYDSDVGRPGGWDPAARPSLDGGPQGNALDDIDYMSEDDEDELSEADSLCGSHAAGRCESTAFPCGPGKAGMICVWCLSNAL